MCNRSLAEGFCGLKFKNTALALTAVVQFSANQRRDNYLAGPQMVLINNFKICNFKGKNK